MPDLKMGVGLWASRHMSPKLGSHFAQVMQSTGSIDQFVLWDQLTNWFPQALWDESSTPLAAVLPDVDSLSDPFAAAAFALAGVDDLGFAVCCDATRREPAELAQTMLTLAMATERQGSLFLGAGEVRHIAPFGRNRAVPFDRYVDNRDTGGFILVDRLTNATVAAGLLHFALRRSHNIHWEAHQVDKQARAALNGHGSAAVWLTGLSGAGKSAIAEVLERRLHASGHHTYLLDGDNVRHGLNKDLGFTDADRVENIRRIAEVAKLMVDAGTIVITAFISPFRSERRLARELLEQGEFVEVHIDTPLAVAEERDVKGLYAKARAGELKNFTGIDSPYEAPESPEVHVDTTAMTPDAAADLLIGRLREMGIVASR